MEETATTTTPSAETTKAKTRPAKPAKPVPPDDKRCEYKIVSGQNKGARCVRGGGLRLMTRGLSHTYYRICDTHAQRYIDDGWQVTSVAGSDPRVKCQSFMIYLLHYDKPIGNPTHLVQHYIGYCEDSARIQAHANGTSGAALPTAFHRRGIGFVVARVFDGSRREERRIKRMKMSPRLCPICRDKRKEHRLCP